MDQSNPETEAAAPTSECCSNPGCKNDDTHEANLPFCAGCKEAQYCSKDCQKQHWRDHKAYCKHVSSGGASSASLDALAYYDKIAAHDSKARALGREVGLAVGRESHGLTTPVRRLVVTGKDTPENIALFFGRGDIADVHRDNRLNVLLRPPPGSPSYVFNRGLGADEGYPLSAWTPREPSAAEAQELREVRDMQDMIRRHMGSRGVEDVSNADMRDILVANFGNRWPERLQTYTMALNTMDRGVHR